jgi:adenylosuccinate synthase
MIDTAHVIVDLQAGDTGKGKIAHALAKKGFYSHVIRYNGGGNAGHTIYHEGQKLVTHFIPVGVIHGIKSIIGPGCVVNTDKLFEEMKQLQDMRFNLTDKLFIDKRAHIITSEHIEEDIKDKKIGTTKTGNGPCYRDKYSRVGKRAEDMPELEHMLIDCYEEFHSSNKVTLLFEGAQGFELDIDWGDYPYVTSSHCLTGSVALSGVPCQKIHKVFGVAKAYRTYVGNKTFEITSLLFDRIRELGQEWGATTGRKRQIDWFNLNDVIKASNINGVTDLIINKLDILKQIQLSLYHNSRLITFNHAEEFKNYITDNILKNCDLVKSVMFSETPFDI